MAVGVVMTTPLVLIEFCSFLYRPSLTLVARSKLKVKIRLWTMDENVDRKTERENSDLSHHILASSQHQCQKRTHHCRLSLSHDHLFHQRFAVFEIAHKLVHQRDLHLAQHDRPRKLEHEEAWIVHHHFLFHFRLRGHSPDFRHIGLWYYLHFGDEMALRG